MSLNILDYDENHCQFCYWKALLIVLRSLKSNSAYDIKTSHWDWKHMLQLEHFCGHNAWFHGYLKILIWFWHVMNIPDVPTQVSTRTFSSQLCWYAEATISLPRAWRKIPKGSSSTPATEKGWGGWRSVQETSYYKRFRSARVWWDSAEWWEWWLGRGSWRDRLQVGVVRFK